MCLTVCLCSFLASNGSGLLCRSSSPQNMTILNPHYLIGCIFGEAGVDGADADSNSVMSPSEAEPDLIHPAEHICYLQLTLRFCLVNILVAISALLIFIM